MSVRPTVLAMDAIRREHSHEARLIAAWRAQRNPAGLLYGALVAAAVIAVSSAVVDSAVALTLAVVEVLLVYWAAHVYSRVLADRLADSSTRFVERAREALRHEVAVLVGGVPALLVFIAASFRGATVSTAANMALLATTLFLGSAGYAVGRQAGARGWSLVGEVAVAALLGILVFMLKAQGLH